MATTEITPSPEQVHSKGEDLDVLKLNSQRGHADDAKEVDVSKISSECQPSVSNENTSPAPTREKHTHQVKEEMSSSIAEKELKIKSKAANRGKPAYDRKVKGKQTGASPQGSALGFSTDVEVSKAVVEESCTDDKPEDPHGHKSSEEVSFAYRAKERVVELWSEWKSRRVCWLAVGCGLLVVAAVIIAGILGTQLSPAWRVALASTLQHKKENSSAFDDFKVINSTPTYLPITNSSATTSVTTNALPMITTFRSTTARRCQHGWTEHNSHCYKFMTDHVSWSDAHSMCRKHGAGLASITSQEENDFIKSLISKSPSQEVWIGLRKDGGSWKWRDGSPFTYSNWNPGEPNNVDGWILPTEECVVMYSKSGRGGKWNDRRCRKKWPYLCKKGNKNFITTRISE